MDRLCKHWRRTTPGEVASRDGWRVARATTPSCLPNAFRSPRRATTCDWSKGMPRCIGLSTAGDQNGLTGERITGNAKRGPARLEFPVICYPVGLFDCLPPRSDLESPHPALRGPLERMRVVGFQDQVSHQVEAHRQSRAEYRNAIGAAVSDSHAGLVGRAGGGNVGGLMREGEVAEVRRLAIGIRHTRVE